MVVFILSLLFYWPIFDTHSKSLPSSLFFFVPKDHGLLMLLLRYDTHTDTLNPI